MVNIYFYGLLNFILLHVFTNRSHPDHFYVPEISQFVSLKLQFSSYEYFTPDVTNEEIFNIQEIVFNIEEDSEQCTLVLENEARAGGSNF